MKAVLAKVLEKGILQQLQPSKFKIILLTAWIISGTVQPFVLTFPSHMRRWTMRF